MDSNGEDHFGALDGCNVPTLGANQNGEGEPMDRDVAAPEAGSAAVSQRLLQADFIVGEIRREDVVEETRLVDVQQEFLCDARKPDWSGSAAQ